MNEDFALESNSGDVFLLGQHIVASALRARLGGLCERCRRSSRHGAVLAGRSAGAHDRTVARSFAPARRNRTGSRFFGQRLKPSALPEGNGAGTATILNQIFLAPSHGCKTIAKSKNSPPRQAVRYVAAQVAAIGLVPTLNRIVFERFFDESGGMQLVVHAPWGARINRAWGFAFRKRFCRSFDFELQASADEDGIVLSLGPQHSFPVESLFGMLTPENGKAFAGASTLGRAGVSNPLALVRHAGFGGVAKQKRPARATQFAAISLRRFAGRRVSRPGRLFGKSSWRYTKFPIIR